jgi:hypothetical protein
MALPVVESTSSGQSETSSVTITAPTGITTGDLLIGSYTAFRFGGSYSNNTPAGWTTIRSSVGTVSNKVGTNTFYKVAVLADETATDYTFTTTTADEINGSILRVSGAAEGNEITVSEVDVITASAGTTISHTGTSTPPTGESLMVMCTGGGSLTSSAVVTTSTYTATPTVTWTEQMDSGYRNGASDGSSHSVATAPYTGTTEFTAYGFTTSEGFSAGLVSVLIVVSSPEDAAGTNTLLEVSPTQFSQAGIGGTTGTNTLLEVSPTQFSQSGSATTPTVWTNETKPSTTWTNESK